VKVTAASVVSELPMQICGRRGNVIKPDRQTGMSSVKRFPYRVCTWGPSIVSTRHINQCGVSVSVLGISVPCRWPDKVVGASLHSSSDLNTVTLNSGIGILDHSDEIERNLFWVGAMDMERRGERERQWEGRNRSRLETW
jgi:hypothetical protein